MSNNNQSSGAKSGIGFWGLLQLAFIVLKLCKVITWSWWLVLIPLWIELLFFAGLIAFVIWLNK